MTIEQKLISAHQKVHAAGKSVTANKQELLAAINEARDEGFTYSDIAETLDISASRVQQLVRQADGRGRSNR